MKDRERKIISFVGKNPFCSQDSIFTKCHIEKSKTTIELIDRLVSEKKINATSFKKRRLYLGDIDILTHLEILTKGYEYSLNKNPPENSSLAIVIKKFLKRRIKVLRAEKNWTDQIDFGNTIDILKWVISYDKEPNEFNRSIAINMLVHGIVNDAYYSRHQLHSSPKENVRLFQPVKIRHVRRSIADLIEMKKKGRQQFGLSKLHYERNLEKITSSPGAWIQRFNAEQGRSIYPNRPDVQITVFDEMLKPTKSSKGGNKKEKPNKLEITESSDITYQVTNRMKSDETTNHKIEKLDFDMINELKIIIEKYTKQFPTRRKVIHK